MELDDKQKKIVADWVEEGLDLSAIQVRLESELKISMTYMDVRFLVGDLELVPKDIEESTENADEEEEIVENTPAEATPDNPFPAPADPMEAGGDSNSEENVAQNDDDSPHEEGDVSISVSSLTKPGMMASGTVTFSDGVTCDWYLDQFGRPGLVPSSEGYQPPEVDMPKFGQKLQQALQSGY